MILAGDIGGTNTRLAAFEFQSGILTLHDHRDYVNRDFASIEAIIGDFLSSYPERFESASLAVAGPVVNNTVTGTNMPWPVEAATVQRVHGFTRVVLLNDLLALAYGVHELRSNDIETLQIGEEDLEGNCAVIAAGTGLGESGLLRRRTGFTPFPSEGGHSDFSPNGEIETQLYLYLHGKFGHVSFERILSGNGIENVFNFLRDTGRYNEPKQLADELSASSNRPSVISRHALAGEYEICVQALILFTSVLGSETGNLALRLFATGGVFIGGGIAPKVAPFLRQPNFLDAFRNKGRMSDLMAKFPVRLIVNQHTGLIGAAAFSRDRFRKPYAEKLELLQ